MDVVTKSVEAAVAPVESDFPGEFEVILSTEARDRDDENLWAEEWKTPLPARIHIDGDHGRTLEKTVGSAVPTLEDGRLIGKGTYAKTDYAQMVRQLVNDGHINSVSVTYAERKNAKGEGTIERELLNAAFVAIPANPEAVVLASKAAKLAEKAEGGVDASGDNPQVKHDDMVQAIHDAAIHLGAQCMNDIEAQSGAADGANKGASGMYTKDEIREHFDLTKSSTSEEVGSPQESAEESAAAAAKAAAAVDESAEDAAREKANKLAAARALAFLIGKNT